MQQGCWHVKKRKLKLTTPGPKVAEAQAASGHLAQHVRDVGSSVRSRTTSKRNILRLGPSSAQSRAFAVSGFAIAGESNPRREMPPNLIAGNCPPILTLSSRANKHERTLDNHCAARHCFSAIRLSAKVGRQGYEPFARFGCFTCRSGGEAALLRRDR